MPDLAGFVRGAAAQTSHLAVERGGAVYLLPTRQKAGVDRLLKAKWKEHRHLGRAVDALGGRTRGTVFVDVGAHVGTTVVAALSLGFESAVAIEPEVENYRLLRANLVLNDLDARARALQLAISDHVGSAKLKLRPSLGSKHRLVEELEPGATAVNVPLMTLDALELEAERIGLLWLDVEGHELEVLQGGETLAAAPVVMEFTPRALKRAGKLEPLSALIAERYTQIVDLREPEVLPVAELRALAKRYSRGFTDVLAFS